MPRVLIAIADGIVSSYHSLWAALTDSETFSVDEAWHITERVQRLNDLIIKRSPEISPWAPGGDSVAVVKVIPDQVEAVAVIDGRSRAQTFSIGDPDRVVHGVSYEPSAVARLF